MRAALLAAAAVGCSGAGMNTHTMVGYRAHQYYGKIMQSPNADKYNKAISENLHAVLAGADFPDFLYACGSYANHHDAGEAAHWPPWQAAAVAYIRNREDFKSGKWSEDTEKLIAFLYGVGAHYIGDELWEGLNPQLGRGQGFVRFLSSFNLHHNGQSDNDEGVANMATDFFVSWAMDESGIKAWSRYYPLKEIADIYHSYKTTCAQGRSCEDFSNVTVTSLFECKLLFDLGLWAEKEFGQILFHIYSEYMNKVPMVAERVLDVPIGGIDDMAVWTSFVWERIARWLDNGSPALPPPNLHAALGKEGDVSADDSEADRWLRDWVRGLRSAKMILAAPALLRLSGGDLVELADPDHPEYGLRYVGPLYLRPAVEELLSGMQLRFNKTAARAVLASALTLRDDVKKTDVKAEQAVASEQKPASSTAGASPVGYYGSALASGDFDGDGTVDVVTGAYGDGKAGAAQVGLVSVRYGNGTVQTLRGGGVHFRFGWAVSALDFNLDGVADLAVTAPTASWNSSITVPDNSYPKMRAYGKVFVFYGSKSGLAETAGFTAATEDPLTAFGLSMDVGDLDGDGSADLIVGAPMSSFKADPSWGDSESIQRGAVFGFLSQKGRTGIVDARHGADLVLEGPAGYGYFGQSSAVLATAGARLLLVGSPGYRNSNATVGRVYAHVLNVTSGRVLAKQTLTLTGAEPLAEFGHSVAVQSSGVVAVSSPAAGAKGSKMRSGQVRLLDGAAVASLAASAHDVVVGSAGFPQSALITGDKKYGRLGWRVEFVGNGDLVVGAPLVSAGVLGSALSASGRERGAVHVWTAKELPSGSVSDTAAHWSVTGTRGRARLGSAFAAVGDGKLAIGSPRAAGDAGEMAGAVDVFAWA